MTPKERVLMAIDHAEPDRVPLDCWLAPEIVGDLAQVLSVDLSKDRFAIGKALGHDILYGAVGIVDGFGSIYMEDRKVGDNLYRDKWGIGWRKQTQEYGCYCEFAEHPLADKKQYDNYKWPTVEESEQAGIKMYEDLIASSGKEYAIIGAVPCTILEAAWYLRGLEDFLADLYVDRDFAIELLDKAMRYHLDLSKRLVELGVDIIWWGDDIAVEAGPLMQPALYRELIKPLHAYMVQEVKVINKDVKIAFHSDGKIDWALDDLVEIGVDILNPLQPDVNDVASIKKQYGDKLTFWGNVDTRRIMSHGSCAEVAMEVKKVIETLAPGGGLILSSNHTVQATPRAVDNTIAFHWAAEKFRDYPITFQDVGGQKAEFYF